MATKSIEAVTGRMEPLLADAGWRVVEKETDSRGMEDEVWRLESTWSPQGAPAYLSFVIDLYPGTLKRGIWMVRASRVHPGRRRSDQGDDSTFYLEKGWIGRCRNFVQGLSRFRADQ